MPTIYERVQQIFEFYKKIQNVLNPNFNETIVRKINNASNVPAPVRKAFSGAGKALPPAMILLMGYALVDIWDDETANYSDDETIAEKMRQTIIIAQLVPPK